jgi:hypothetical protein
MMKFPLADYIMHTLTWGITDPSSRRITITRGPRLFILQNAEQATLDFIANQRGQFEVYASNTAAKNLYREFAAAQGSLVPQPMMTIHAAFTGASGVHIDSGAGMNRMFTMEPLGGEEHDLIRFFHMIRYNPDSPADLCFDLHATAQFLAHERVIIIVDTMTMPPLLEENRAIMRSRNRWPLLVQSNGSFYQTMRDALKTRFEIE